MRRLSLTRLSSESDILKQTPPTTVVCCNSREEREQFGKSEITQDGSDAFNLPPDESDIGLQLTADPYFYHTLSLAGSGDGGVGNRRNSTSNTSGRRHINSTTSNYTQIIQLKLQLARQQESIEQLSSQLRACKVENEVLIAENKSLVNEVVDVHKRGDDSTAEEDSNNELATTYGATQITQRLERGLSRGTSFRTERTEQIITDNERLMKENEKLKTMNNILKKSFQNYVKKDSLQRKSDNAHQSNTFQGQQQHRRQTIAVPPTRDITKSINVYDYLNKRRISNSTESTCFNSSADAAENPVHVKKVHNNDDARLSSITIDESIRVSESVDDSFRTLKSGNMSSRQLLGREEEEEEEVNDFGEASRRLLEGSDCYGIYSNRAFS